MLKPILKLLPIWISPAAQARFQQLIFYGLADRILIFPFSFFASVYSVKEGRGWRMFFRLAERELCTGS
jgi:hypothetical protein